MYSPGRPYIVVAPVVTSWAVAGQRMVFFHMFLQARVTLEAFPIVAPRGTQCLVPHSGNHGYIRNLRRFVSCIQIFMCIFVEVMFIEIIRNLKSADALNKYVYANATSCHICFSWPLFFFF